jgi:hypothetical protein
VDIILGEAEATTYADALLRDDVGNRRRGHGHTSRHQPEAEPPRAANEIAAGHALLDLGRQMLRAAERADRSGEPTPGQSG